jgi:hypothetical protein
MGDLASAKPKKLRDPLRDASGLGYCLRGGILFGILDGLINANPIANKLYEVYTPIAKTSVNLMAGLGEMLILGILYGLALQPAK